MNALRKPQPATKSLQIAAKRSRSVKKGRPQVEVEPNLPFGASTSASKMYARHPVTPAADTATKTTAPERSLNQRMDALQRANDIRSRRAQLKKDLKAGRVSIHTLLADPPEFVETAKVFDMLLAVPKYGRVKVNKVLTTCRISPSKTIGGLSERQRNELVQSLRR